jgi:exodeoxyribonuclease VII small subunit
MSTPEPTPPGATAPTPTSATATYETAVARIEEIIRRLDSGQAGLRETLDLVKEGRDLVEYCAGELDAVGQGLEELKLDDLVSRLDGAQGPRGER